MRKRRRVTTDLHKLLRDLPWCSETIRTFDGDTGVRAKCRAIARFFGARRVLLPRPGQCWGALARVRLNPDEGTYEASVGGIGGGGDAGYCVRADGAGGAARGRTGDVWEGGRGSGAHVCAVRTGCRAGSGGGGPDGGGRANEHAGGEVCRFASARATGAARIRDRTGVAAHGR